MKETHDINSLLTLVKIVLAFQHKRQPNCQDLLTIENTDSDLKVHALHYANDYSYASDLPFKNFCKLAKQAETIKTGLGYSQINSIPAWSKEFSYRIFFYRTNAKVYAYN